MPSATARDFQRVARLLGFSLTRRQAVMSVGIIQMADPSLSQCMAEKK